MAEHHGRAVRERAFRKPQLELARFVHLGPAKTAPGSQLPVRVERRSARHLSATSSVREAARTARSAWAIPRDTPSPQRIRAASLRWIVASRRVVPLRLGERLLVERLGLPWLGLRSREPDEHPGQLDAACGLRARACEQGRGSGAVADGVVDVGGEEQAPAGIGAGCGRREPECLLGELRGSGGSAAARRRSGGILERGGDLGARLGRGEGEVTGPFLLRGDALREPRVQRPAAKGRLTAADRGAEQRVSEAQALPVQLEDPRCERLVCAGPGLPPGGNLDELHGRVGKRGDHAGNLERRGAEVVEALLQEPAEVGGDRELLARGKRAAPALERSCQLEREEGLPRATSPRS